MAMTLTRRALPTTVARSRSTGAGITRPISKAYQPRGELEHPLTKVTPVLGSGLNKAGLVKGAAELL